MGGQKWWVLFFSTQTKKVTFFCLTFENPGEARTALPTSDVHKQKQHDENSNFAM